MLTATAGSDVADSYVTVLEATAYFNAHWSSAKQDLWADLSPAARETLLKAATKVIEQLRFTDSAFGVVIQNLISANVVSQFYPGQRLSFPRNIDYDILGIVYVPQEVMDAQCEQAIYMINFDDSTIANQLQGVMEEAVAAGGVRIYAHYQGRGSFIAPMALEMLKPFLRYGTRFGRG